MQRRVIKNASWIIVCRIVQAILSLVISILTARYLGPSNYGIITYAASIVSFVTPIMQLGLNNTLVREYVSFPDKEGEILGTSTGMSMISALFCIVGVVSFSLIANASELEITLVCALYSLLLIFQSLGLIEYWFQYKLLSKYTALVSLCAYVLISAYKFVLLITGKSVFWFAVSNALDYMIISISLFVIYKRIGGNKVSFSLKLARNMLRDSKYYILSGLMITLFAQTDRIMLKHMVGTAETGFYSVASNCVGMTSFVFVAIIDSMRPVLLKDREDDIGRYERGVICLYSVVIYLAIGASVALTILAKPVLPRLYGEEYLAAVRVLQILAWYTTFSYYGGAKDVWILAEGKHRYLVLLNSCGAATNIALNYWFIPIWGARGAALASLITQFFTNVIMVFLIKAIRRNGYLFICALNPKSIISYFRLVREE